MIRLISGRFRGRRLMRPPERYTRPTADRIREALFNIITHHPEISLQDAVVLDLFAGSGACGLEALSRGASHVYFLEQQREVLTILKKNIHTLKAEAQTTVYSYGIQQLPLAKESAHLIFMDPPYHQGLETVALNQIREKGWISPETVIILELPSVEMRIDLSGFTLIDSRTYGITTLVFLRV